MPKSFKWPLRIAHGGGVSIVGHTCEGSEREIAALKAKLEEARKGLEEIACKPHLGDCGHGCIARSTLATMVDGK